MLEKVLVTCVGNICRSPMAEALLHQALAGRPGALVASAGIGALVGEPAHVHAREAMARRGLDITKHRAQQVTAELVARFDLVLVMEQEHQFELERMVPSARGRVRRLGHFGKFDIDDPYGKGPEEFEKALVLIERGVTDFHKAFWSRP